MADKEKNPTWLKITLALIAGGLVPALFMFMTQIYNGKNKDKNPHTREIHSQLTSISSIYNQLSILYAHTSAYRIILLKAHDSGTPIPSKCSVIAAISEENMVELTNWKAQPLDIQYIAMLKDLIAEGRVSYSEVEKMEDGVLKNVYLSNGVGAADIYYLGTKDDLIYYLAINFQEEAQFENPRYETQTRLSVNKIKNLLRKIQAIK